VTGSAAMNYEGSNHDALGRVLNALHERLGAGPAGCGANSNWQLPIVPNSALAQISRAFALSSFETAVLALTASVELLPGFDRLCGEYVGRPDQPWPTIELCLSLFPDAAWEAFLPNAPLRGQRLVVAREGEVLTTRPLRIQERVLHALLGHDCLDERLERRLARLQPPEALPQEHALFVDELCRRRQDEPLLILHLWGTETSLSLLVAAQTARRTHKIPWLFDAAMLPKEAKERDELVRLWNREARLGSVDLVVCVGSALDPTTERELRDMLLRLETGAFVVARELPNLGTQLTRNGITESRFQVPSLDYDGQLTLWRKSLKGRRVATAVQQELAAQFRLSPAAISAAARELAVPRAADEAPSSRDVLWKACRLQARPRMSDLAQPIEIRATLDQVVLASSERESVDALVSQVRRRATVHHAWGFAEAGLKGAGTTAVFAGPSGTGKSMCAEAVANELQLDLFRIDLSAVVSKYIGETEENLRRVFDAAEAGGAILLFDEADALFGKRTEVKDSHDRHANIEVSYLLQRLEAYSGLAILTTNLRKNIDSAFIRRVQFIIDFKFPEPKERERIWQGILPSNAPKAEDFDPSKLASLSMAGGNIRSIARNAAYLAADQGKPIGMLHLLRAARLEYGKLGKTLPASEVQGWVPMSEGGAP
jgi:hypothetical protein